MKIKKGSNSNSAMPGANQSAIRGVYGKSTKWISAGPEISFLDNKSKLKYFPFTTVFKKTEISAEDVQWIISQFGPDLGHWTFWTSKSMIVDQFNISQHYSQTFIGFDKEENLTLFLIGFHQSL